MTNITFTELTKILEPYNHKQSLTPKEASGLSFALIELLMTGSCDRFTLKVVSRFMSITTYDDLLTERTLNHYCGYPLCEYNNPKKIKDAHLSSAVKVLKLPRIYKTRFCTKGHYQCSEFYRKQLSPEALWGRSNILTLPIMDPHSFESKMILLDELLEMESTNNQMDDVIKLLTEMNVADPELDTADVIDKFNEFQIRENEGFQQSDTVYK